jgi:hypothetical protein
VENVWFGNGLILFEMIPKDSSLVQFGSVLSDLNRFQTAITSLVLDGSSLVAHGYTVVVGTAAIAQCITHEPVMHNLAESQKFVPFTITFRITEAAD